MSKEKFLRLFFTIETIIQTKLSSIPKIYVPSTLFNKVLRFDEPNSLITIDLTSPINYFGLEDPRIDQVFPLTLSFVVGRPSVDRSHAEVFDQLFTFYNQGIHQEKSCTEGVWVFGPVKKRNGFYDKIDKNSLTHRQNHSESMSK